MDQRNFHQTGNMIFLSGEELEYLGKSYNPGSGPPFPPEIFVQPPNLLYNKTIWVKLG